MLKCLIGYSAKGLETSDVTEWVHALVAGQTKGGKTNFARVVLTSLCYHYGPHYLHVFIFDYKRSGFVKFRGLPWVKAFTDDFHESVELLAVIFGELERRKKLFDMLGVEDISEYNSTRGKMPRLPYMLLIVDEYQVFHDSATGKFKFSQALMARMWQWGRAFGLHCIVITQRPTSDVIHGHVKSNCDTRVALRCATAQDSRNVLDRPGAESLPKDAIGRALFQTGGDILEIQVPLLTSNDAQAILVERATYYDSWFKSKGAREATDQTSTYANGAVPVPNGPVGRPDPLSAVQSG